MAEEIIKSSAAPEIRNSRRKSIAIPGSPDSGKATLPSCRRVSLGSSPIGGNLRRNSTGRTSSQKSGDDILPHYLRASTGSCHDFCKYGRKHAHELKSRNPIPKRIVKSSSKEETIINEVVPAERKKRAAVKPKLSPDPKVPISEPPEIIKREILLPSKKVEVSSKRDSSINRKLTQNDLKMPEKHSPSVKPKPVMVKPSSSSDASAGLNQRRNSNIKIGKKMGIPKVSAKKVLTTPTVSLSPKPALSRVVSLKLRKRGNPKLVSPLKDQNRLPKAEPKEPDNEMVQEKTLHVVEAEAEDKVLESVPPGDIIKSPPPLSVLSPNSSAPKSSHTATSDEDLDESEYSYSEEDDLISENEESGLETSKGNHNRTPHKGRAILSEDKEDKAVRLKFRRGRVVDLQSENNGPRRLRFRRGRVLGDNEDGQGSARRRTFKKKGIDNETKDSGPGSKSVVLKHQDVQGKKDAQGLLNNVIEETASKLVESRKSKVKALVGAFETVISLQDGKPSMQTVI